MPKDRLGVGPPERRRGGSCLPRTSKIPLFPNFKAHDAGLAGADAPEALRDAVPRLAAAITTQELYEHVAPGSIVKASQYKVVLLRAPTAEPFESLAVSYHGWTVFVLEILPPNGAVACNRCGSIDANICVPGSSSCGNLNTIQLAFDGGGTFYTLTGADLIPKGAIGEGLQGNPADNEWVTSTGLAPFDHVTFSTTGNAFEFALPTVPEPSTWALMALGFAGLGYTAFRRNSKARAIAI